MYHKSGNFRVEIFLEKNFCAKIFVVIEGFLVLSTYIHSRKYSVCLIFIAVAANKIFLTVKISQFTVCMYACMYVRLYACMHILLFTPPVKSWVIKFVFIGFHVS